MFCASLLLVLSDLTVRPPTVGFRLCVLERDYLYCLLETAVFKTWLRVV